MEMLSPGIQIVEKDISLTAKQVPSSITAIIVRSDWGEALKPILVTSEAELVEKFGEPDNWNYEDWYQAWNFLQYSRNLYVIRPIDKSVENPAIMLDADENDSLKAVVEYASFDEMYNSDIAELKLSRISSPRKLTFIFKYVSSKATDFAIAVCSSKDCWDKPICKTNGQVIFEPEIQPVDGSPPLPFSAFFEYEPDWDNGEFAVLVFKRDPESKHFELAESFVCNYNPNKRDAYGRNYFAEEVFFNQSKYFYCKVGEGNPVNTANNELITVQFSSNLNVYPATGNYTDGTLAYDGSGWKKSDIMEAEALLSNPEEFQVNLLVAHALDINGLPTIADQRRDCFCIVPLYDQEILGKSASDATSYIVEQYGIRSTQINKKFNAYNSYTGIYGNIKYQYDKFNDVNRWIPVGGDIAGLIALMDKNYDPWWAPAGFDRGKIRNVIKLAFQPGRTHRDILYYNAVNPIMNVPGEGAAIVWGQKTAIRKPSAMDRVNVRRLLLYLEAVIKEVMMYFLFEFNDEITRARIRGVIEPFLRDVKARRGLYDYLVVCDETNNTPEIIDRNELVVDIYVKPVRVAEFIRINMNVVKTGVKFEEVVGKV